MKLFAITVYKEASLAISIRWGQLGIFRKHLRQHAVAVLAQSCSCCRKQTASHVQFHYLHPLECNGNTVAERLQQLLCSSVQRLKAAGLLLRCLDTAGRSVKNTSAKSPRLLSLIKRWQCSPCCSLISRHPNQHTARREENFLRQVPVPVLSSLNEVSELYSETLH